MKKTCALIVNPVSGGYSEAGMKHLKALLEDGGIGVEVMATTGPDDARSFAGELCRNLDDPLIIAAGGDGTVNGVLNGLHPGKGVLAVVPLGTANVLARELKITSAEDAVSRIVRGVSRPMTVGVVEGRAGERRFLLMAGAGLDGAVVKDLRIPQKRVLGKGAYILAALRRLASWEGGRFEVVADGTKVECHSMIACNASRYGGGFVLAPGADIFSHGLRVVCVTGNGPVAYLRLFLSICTGRVGETGEISLLTASHIRIGGSVAIQLDGDYYGDAPASIRAVQGFTRLIV